jgi:acetyl-CoA carboxylase biotin carboxylase subunit
MFRKILIANRGEIAVRVIRACKAMGIKTVAIFSEADRDALHVKLADEAFCVGPPPSAKSYLNSHNIISAALVSDADAIHPGYGFLSENPSFAEICQTHHLQFIGPSVEAMEKLGDKAEARRIAESQGVPIIPGSHVVKDVDDALETAKKIGFPVMIKAAAGGGGKGMRMALNASELEKHLPMAQAEAQAAFGDPRVYLEKYLVEPRHIEVQILGDSFGNVVAVGERECSLQRKHQKVVEESPSIAVTPEIRKRIQEMAVRIAKAVRYLGAGTIEFLMDKSGEFYFIEANARIQVEHPVTEMVSGLDLIVEQIRVASGEPLRMKQEEIQLQGHAIECRINAEDPETFAPSAGTIEFLHWPGGPGIRVDSHLRAKDRVPPFYDSMIGKLIAYGKDRSQALSRMLAALDECEISGISTNLPFHRKLLRHPAVQKGEMHVKFIETIFADKVLL